MTDTTSLDTHAGPAPPTTGSVAPPPTTATAPAIHPGLGRLDRRRRTLAFSIRTYGLPYFEVLLTTERALFDSANAARRTPANFYASRQDGGLSRSGVDESAFIVPAAALQRFAAATPRPGEIFYTVASYATPESVPVLAAPPAILALTAPSVMLAADFQAEAFAVVLGVPVHKLRPVADEPVVPAVSPAQEQAPPVLDPGPAAGATAWSPTQAEEAFQASMGLDALDAFEGHMALEEPPAPDPVPADRADQGDPGAAGYAAEAEPVWTAAYADEDEPPEATAEAYGEAYDEPPEATAAGYEEAYGDEFPYDDGYGDEPTPTRRAAHADEDDPHAEPTGSTFAPDAREPAALSDDEERLLDDELARAASYDDAYDEDLAGVVDASRNGSAPVAVAPVAARELDIPARIALVSKLGRLFHAADGFRSTSADAVAGLRYGLVGFTQDRGDLGRLLVMMRERDPGRFHEVFGPDADELVHVTTRHGPRASAAGQRSARLAPVAGHDLWTEPWLSRFRAAGEHPAFQAAQNELAVRRYLDPVLGLASRFGMTTERALALLAERALEVGPRRAEHTLAPLLGELAQPDLGVVMDALVARAGGADPTWRLRAQAIRSSAEFGDAPLRWTPPAATGRG